MGLLYFFTFNRTLQQNIQQNINELTLAFSTQKKIAAPSITKITINNNKKKMNKNLKKKNNTKQNKSKHCAN